jgi:hypothetical protein
MQKSEFKAIQAQTCKLGVHNALAAEIRGILCNYFHSQLVMQSTVLVIVKARPDLTMPYIFVSLWGIGDSFGP